MQSVGQIVRHRREALGMTLGAVAERGGLTKSYLSMIENHRVSNPPSPTVLAKLAGALSLDVELLRDAAAWQRTPEAVRDEVRKLTDKAQRGQSLADWLDRATPKRGGVRKLDQLYRSGQLRKRIHEALKDEASSPGDSINPIASQPMHTSRAVPLINKVAAGYPTDFTDLDYPARTADDYVPAHGIEDVDAFAATVVGESMEPAYREGDVVVFSPLADVTDGCDCFVRLEPDHQTTFKRVFIDESAQTIRLQPLNPSFAPRVCKREEVAGLYRAVMRISRI